MLFSLYFTARVFAQPYLISTVAGDGTFGYTGDGGAATAADLTPNYGIAADGSGNFYIACGSDNVVRMVNSSGVISTIAGTGLPGYTGDGGAATAAKLNNPIGVAYSGGILYIADAGNNVVREIQSGIISTFAGVERRWRSGYIG